MINFILITLLPANNANGFFSMLINHSGLTLCPSIITTHDIVGYRLKAKPAFVVTVCHSFVRLFSSDITYSQQLHSSRDVSPGNLGYLVSVIPSNAVCSEEQHSIILLNKSFHILKHFHIILTTCLGSLRIIDKLEHELEHPRISLCSVSSVQKLSSRH